MNYMDLKSEDRNAQKVILGIGYDGTTSYRPGARFAPTEVRNNSLIGYETYSPALDKDLLDENIIDLGDVEVSYSDPKIVQQEIEEVYDEVLKKDVKLCTIGGEHSITSAIVKSLYKKYGEFKVIQFDAHTDLRDSYLGSKYSHACVMKRVCETIGSKNLYQVGIRSGLKEEFEYANNHTNMYKYTLKDIKDVVKQIKDQKVYITIDLDVLDPAYFPGTGTPEPNGVSTRELFDAIYELKNLDNVIGFDVVELAPMLDNSQISTSLAIKVIREMLLVV